MIYMTFKSSKILYTVNIFIISHKTEKLNNSKFIKFPLPPDSLNSSKFNERRALPSPIVKGTQSR